MAKSLGSITLDMALNYGSVIEGFDAVEKKTKKTTDGIGKLGSVMKTGMLAGAAALTGVVAAIGAIASETAEAAAEQAQLAAVLKSTGQAAGFTQDSLNKMGDSMRKATTLDGGDITKAQTALLAFTNITGEQFPKALQAAADMAARTGMTIQQTSELIGRALDVPSQGMAALSKQGFRFTDAQKDVIKHLEETGQSAKAQDIILASLKDTYGGAAEAARKTFGGALEAVKNSLKELITGADGSLDGAASSVNDLAKTLDSPEVKAGINTLVSGLSDIAVAAVKLISGVATAMANTASFTQWLFGGIDNNNIGQVQERLGEVTAGIDKLNKKREEGYQLTAQEYAQLAYLQKQQRELSKTVAEYEGGLKKEADAQKAAAKAAADAAKENKRLADAKLAAEKAAAAAAAAEKIEKDRKNSIKEILVGLNEDYQALGKSKEELTLRTLELLGATEKEMAFAKISQDMIKEWGGFFSAKPLNSDDIIGKDSDEFKSDEEKENERYAAQLKRFKKHQEDMAIQGKTSAITMEDLERVHQENLSNIRRQFSKDDLSKTQNALGTISTLMNSHSRKMFEIGKAAAIGKAIVATSLGVMEALTIPFIGWAMAPLVAAAGIQNIAAIKNASFGGGSVATAAPSVTQGVNAQMQQVQPTQRTNINLQGDFFSRDGVISLLNEAFKDGYTLNGATA